MSKKIKIPKDVEKALGVDLELIESKMANIIKSKKGQSLEDITKGQSMVNDYKDFSKEEVLALFMDAAAEAGFLRHKMAMLMAMGAVDLEVLKKVMSADIDEVKDRLRDGMGLKPDSPDFL